MAAGASRTVVSAAGDGAGNGASDSASPVPKTLKLPFLNIPPSDTASISEPEPQAQSADPPTAPAQAEEVKPESPPAQEAPQS